MGVIDNYLKDAGLDRTRVVKAEVVVTDHANKPAFNEAWATWMPAGCGPVRSFVQSMLLPANVETLLAATHMARRGVPLWKIVKILGNTPEVIERVYAKHCPDDLREAVDTITGGAVEMRI